MVQLLKRVNNSDPGDADHVGGNDWDTLSDYLNDVNMSPGQVIISTATTFNLAPTIKGSSFSIRRDDAAGDQGLEFGPNHATGGTAFMDWHISSGDGDYSTRMRRNSGTNGVFELIQTGTGDFVHKHESGTIGLAGPYYRFDNTGIKVYRGATMTHSDSPYPIWVYQNVTATSAAPPDLPGIYQEMNYTATDITDPYDLFCNGIQSTIRYGVGGAAAKGSAIAFTSQIDCTGSGHINNEVASFMSWNRSNTTAALSHWCGDLNIHGPIAVQSGLLTGINMFINNHYNGTPTRGKTGCFIAQTRPGTGGGATATHQAATTYKLDYGIGVFGFAGTVGSPVTGFNIGVQIGGIGGIWVAEASKITTGIKIADIETAAIDLSDVATSATTPAGIIVSTASRTYDSFIDLTGGLAPTTAAIKLGQRTIVGTTMRLFENGVNTWDVAAISNTFSMLRLVPNISTVASTAVRGVLRVANTAAGGSPEYLEISARGTNGYTVNATQESSGTLRPLTIQMGANDCITVNIDNTMNFNNRSVTGLIQKFNDVTKVNTDSPYSIATTDSIIRANATSGALTITLPTAVGVTGKLYRIMRIDTVASSNLVTVATTSSQTISNAASWYLWPGEYVTVESDGANWIALAYSNPNQSNYYFLGGSTPNTRYIAGMIPDTTGPLQTSTTSPAANLLWALPLMVGKPTKFDLLTFNVTTGAAINARAGIYRDSGACYPGALIFDTGSIDCTAAAEKTTTITSGLQTFAPGLYWLAWECASNTIQIRILPANSLWGLLGFTGSANIPRYGYSVAHTYGALPDPYTTAATLLATAPAAAAPVPAIMLRAI